MEPDHGAVPWRVGLWPCLRENCGAEAESSSLCLVLALSLPAVWPLQCYFTLRVLIFSHCKHPRPGVVMRITLTDPCGGIVSCPKEDSLFEHKLGICVSGHTLASSPWGCLSSPLECWHSHLPLFLSDYFHREHVSSLGPKLPSLLFSSGPLNSSTLLSHVWWPYYNRARGKREH